MNIERRGNMNSRPLVFVQLNEVNFNVAQEYIDAGHDLPNFRRLLSFCSRLTTSEEEYELLEPWIQWPSVYTGKTFAQHQIFRLGDAELRPPRQIFEVIEERGFRVGAISPMNAVNNLESPAYFIPDPWTRADSDTSALSQMLTKALRQTVNDNSKAKITLRSRLRLMASFVFLVRPKRYLKLLSTALKTRGRPWRRALFLDRLLHEIHLTLLGRNQPDFSTVFLNAGAHIQHHYFLNSKSRSVLVRDNPSWYVGGQEDPLREMLDAYDDMLGDLISTREWEILVATGLTQNPVQKSVFYYRLRDHQQFLSRLGLPFESVLPRMTRDFLVLCHSEGEALALEQELKKVVDRKSRPIFGEIDNRGKDLFIVLDYPHEITEQTQVLLAGEWSSFFDEVVFVANKNGEHSAEGFAYFSSGLEAHAPSELSHVSALFSTICGYFGVGYEAPSPGKVDL